jgi:hypothetical protein
MQKSESIVGLATALAAAQGRFHSAKKSSDNPFFKSKYADLSSVIDACREAMEANGLSVVQIPSFADGRVHLETVLMHKSGEWMSGSISTKPVKEDSQSIGSSISYLRRYSLASFLGIAQEDDDGNAATGKQDEKPAGRNGAGSKIAEPVSSEVYTGTLVQKNALFARCSREGIQTDKMKDIAGFLTGKQWGFLDTLIIDAKAEQENEKK